MTYAHVEVEKSLKNVIYNLKINIKSMIYLNLVSPAMAAAAAIAGHFVDVRSGF